LLLQFFPKRITRIPHLITIHTLSYQSIDAERPTALKRIIDRGEKNYLTEFSEKLIFKKADILVANSLYTKKILVSQYGISNSKIRVVYMGHPELNSIKFGVEQRRNLAFMFSITGEPIILFVGRLVHRKGLPYLLKAARELKNREIKFKLIIVGTGPEKDRYKVQVKKLRLKQNVVFTGFVDESTLKKLYMMSDVVTFPSINEPFGLVVLEAMVAEKPIVASMSGGIPEIIEDPYNGALIDPQNTLEYADALQLFLEDRETSMRVGKANRKKVTEKFTWKECAKHLSSIYETLLKMR
jgi:glycosyltransferase involved in cell wall biosynthesis